MFLCSAKLASSQLILKFSQKSTRMHLSWLMVSEICRSLRGMMWVVRKMATRLACLCWLGHWVGPTFSSYYGDWMSANFLECLILTGTSICSSWRGVHNTFSWLWCSLSVSCCQHTIMSQSLPLIRWVNQRTYLGLRPRLLLELSRTKMSWNLWYWWAHFSLCSRTSSCSLIAMRWASLSSNPRRILLSNTLLLTV